VNKNMKKLIDLTLFGSNVKETHRVYARCDRHGCITISPFAARKFKQGKMLENFFAEKEDFSAGDVIVSLHD